MYLIKKVSEMSGVSVRTLHHYDAIGLLSPQKSENGYRYYSEEELSCLQTILFYKFLGFPLKQIKSLLHTEDQSLLAHLKTQLTLMQKQKSQIQTLIDTLEKTIRAYERKTNMTTEEKFKGFTYQDNQKYTEAAKEKYGRDVVEQSLAKQKGREEEVAEGFNSIFRAFAENMHRGLPAISSENTALAKALHAHLCQYSFDCSREVFSAIGFGYVQNPEFKQNIDKFAVGTAQYVCDAIQQYAGK